MAVLGKMERDGLIAGDFPTKVEAITVTGPAEFQRGDVIAKTGNESYTLVDSAGSGGAELVVGIICDDITVEDGSTAVTNMYIKGEFAQRHLRFGGDDTVENHRRRMTEIGLIIRETRV